MIAIAENILESYFIKVGALPDASSFTALGKQLVKTGLSVATFSETAVKDILKLDIVVTAAFGAMGLGLVELANKTAMADQSYRLLGLRMLMTKESARAMQLALDELGATIDEVAYDQELNKRFHFLYEQNLKMGRLLGENFDDITEKLRSFRMEYKQFGVEFEMTVWSSITKLFSKLGYDQDSVLKKLRSINDWFVDNIPEISDKLATRLVPVWDDVLSVIGDVRHNLELAGSAFIHLTGLVAGDKSLENAKLDFDSLATATQQWVDWLDKAVLNISLAGRMMYHFGKGAIETARGYLDLTKTPEEAQKNIDAAKYHLGVFDKDFRYVQGDRSSWLMNDDLRDLENLDKAIANRKLVENIRSTFPSSTDFHSAVKDLLRNYPEVSSAMVASIIKEESGGNIFAHGEGSSATGLMQLIEATRKRYGVTDEYDPVQNIRGGSAYLSDLLKLYSGNLPKAFMAYHRGEGEMATWGKLDQILTSLQTQGLEPGQNPELDKALAEAARVKITGTVKRNKRYISAFENYELNLRELYGEKLEGMPFPDIPQSREAQAYTSRIMKDFAGYQKMIEKGGSDTIIDTINIYVPKNMSEQEATRFTKEVFNNEKEKRTRNSQAQTAGGPFD